MTARYNIKIHHRRSIRLEGYDYSQAGAYFVTICLKDRSCLLGDVVCGEVEQTDAGRMIEHWWIRLPSKYPNVELDAYVIMPNHLHGVILFCRGDLVQPEDSTPFLGNVIGWFKTMTTNMYIRGVRDLGWHQFEGKLWQRNYYEHIVRNEDELDEIRE